MHIYIHATLSSIPAGPRTAGKRHDVAIAYNSIALFPIRTPVFFAKLNLEAMELQTSTTQSRHVITVLLNL